ncbi:MAG: class I SAM-dependent methyltransferase, partial [Acidimicrobiia bacterium]|nr:class I SAM-dependent methyltransferase [Acidimicrobiia bacterium]
EPDGTSFVYEFTDRPLGAHEHIRMRRPIGRADEVLANRGRWEAEADWYAEVAARNWDATELTWGMFGVGDADLGSAMPDVAGKDVLEIGCGTGYVSHTCLKAGARWAAGLDNSPGQLATARRMARERAVELPLIHGDGNRLPVRDESFDVAINEYGAAIWCDPYKWIPEAARVLRDHGLLWFLGNSTLQTLAQPDYEAEAIGPRLHRPQRGMYRFTWPDDDGVEYHLSHGDMIRLLRSSGFEVLDLVEVYTDPDDDSRYSYADPQWSSQWPVEEIWIARRQPRARVTAAG